MNNEKRILRIGVLSILFYFHLVEKVSNIQNIFKT